MNIFGTTFNYQRRMTKIRKLMEERNIDVILVHSGPNQYYVSGMYQPAPWYPIEINSNTETPLIIFQDKKKDPIFLITYLTGNGLKEGTWIKDVRFVDQEPLGKMSWWQYTAQILKENGVDEGNIGIENDVCVISTFTKLQSVLPKAKFKECDDIFQIARMVKDSKEIAIIKESVLITEACLQAGIKKSGVGVLESEIINAAEIEGRKRGAIREVETMCQSGIRTGHHRAMASNWKRVEENDLVMIDIGLVYKGYGSDLTRTWIVGKPTKLQKKVTDDLIKAHNQVMKLIKPGTTIRKIIASGNNTLAEAGYIKDRKIVPTNTKGMAYVGIHGIGLGPMHDPPHVEYEDTDLESGMTLAVSATARFQEFTIRFEDDVVVVPGGIELINKLIPYTL